MNDDTKVPHYPAPRTMLLFLLTALMCFAKGVAAQDADGAILEAVRGVYAGMSADPGEDRDWRAWEQLFVPSARLVNVRGSEPEEIEVRTWNVSDWIVRSGLGLEGRGFVEEVVHSVTESYGGMASVFLTYAISGERGGEVTGRGAAALQLARTTEGWRVASWVWTSEQEGIPLP